jgi:hypothetical protein
MPLEEIVAKFDENAAAILGPAERRALVDAILSLDGAKDASKIVGLSICAGVEA